MSERLRSPLVVQVAVYAYGFDDIGGGETVLLGPRVGAWGHRR